MQDPQNDKYKMFKNFMHNELDISKEDIRQWVKEAVAEEARKLVLQSYESFNVESYIENCIIQKGYYSNNRQLITELKDKIAKLLANKLEIVIGKK